MMSDESGLAWRRLAISLVAALGIGLAFHSANSKESSRVNRDSAQIEEFRKNVTAYAALHNEQAANLPSLKPTTNPEKISAYQHALADKIREARAGAKRGDVFTQPAAEEFRRLIALSLGGRQATRIKSSMQSSPKANVDIAVNEQYPESAPLETMPSSLLLNLPELPRELEYRVVAHSLILRDVAANLIVDYLPNAVP